eukprot:Seg9612.1 transcript_id=Seg9612.1/GoldUCD/mRNA.D3Y31 product="hypothetical protein" protein_id=Seg9612.1/GoldUCD/D3Y31
MHKLPQGILPRYRGNRLHIVFHLCGIYVQHHNIFSEFFKDGNSCGGLRKSILEDFQSDIAKTEMTVLGLLGKMLSGPWMKTLCVSVEDQDVNYVEGINVIKNVIVALEDQLEDPEALLSRKTCFFGNTLDASDSTLAALQRHPKNDPTFKEMVAVKAIKEIFRE